MLSGKTIIVGITGGIAAYKAAEFIRGLKKLNAIVYVIMTKNACNFITPLTFQTLSQNPVTVDMFKAPSTWEIEHISLAQKGDLFVIIPASANIIGKVANGIADDMLSTTIMATKAPVIFACAMNSAMYQNQIVQHNISKLKKVGYIFIEPDCGTLACGQEGQGRLADLDDIIDKTIRTVRFKLDFTGRTILISAGPTKEFIDPIRFVSNGSSGKMGYALAKVAAGRGARVILISGPVKIKKPCGVECIDVTSAQEMYEEVIKRFEYVDVVIKAAAVADYRPVNTSKNKIKKTSSNLVLEMIKNPDILKEIGSRKGKKILVGFSMETENLEKNALMKLNEKNLDLIIANDITAKGAGFENDTNIVKIIDKFGMTRELPIMSKEQVANEILDDILKLEKI